MAFGLETGVENVVNAVHSVFDRLKVADVAYVELDFVCDFGHFSLKLVTHIVLFFLVSRENSDFADICF